MRAAAALPAGPVRASSQHVLSSAPAALARVPALPGGGQAPAYARKGVTGDRWQALISRAHSVSEYGGSGGGALRG